MDGIINIYKEKGFTSFDVVAKLRGILRTKKIGHTGTLDPDAVGVLPVCVGKATRLCEMFTDHDKVYECVMCLGVETDTEDMTGTVLRTVEVSHITEDMVLETLKSFVGTYMQIPPMYSAIKVNGRKLYELAREGRVIEREARKVEIYSVELLEGSEWTLPYIAFRVHCSKGTYVRSLCRDAGERLGVCACMKELVRTRTGQFSIEHALSLLQVEEMVRHTMEAHGATENTSALAEEALSEHLLSFNEIFQDYPTAWVHEEQERLLLNGNPLTAADMAAQGDTFLNNMKEDEILCVCDSRGVLKGLYARKNDSSRFYPYRMFL